MILLAENTVLLTENVNTVFKYVTNMENYKLWFPGVIGIKSMNNLVHGQIGKQYIEELYLPNGTKKLIIEVKESTKNKKFVTIGDLEPLRPMMTMLFSDNGKNSCEFQLNYSSRNSKLKNSEEFIVDIKNNLSERIIIAIKNLRLMFEK